jgi:hypothetical protein
MSVDETIALLKADENRRREAWERTRQQCFYSVAPYSEKIKQASDLFKFPWDIKEKKEARHIPKEQVTRNVKQIEKWLDKKK